MPVQGSDAALNSYYQTIVGPGSSADLGLLHVAGMTRLTWHVVLGPAVGILPPLCAPLIGYRTTPGNTGDLAFTQPPVPLLPALPPALTAGGYALFNLNTVATEVMAIRITNNDPAATIGVTVILSASA